ncbi:apolipoprotein N-acyltransferase [Stieleria varia]|uniref:Apolipoprotein N-acyltransferase n=1 Tax=Stieleria varia TaxID=2528005 RepID=A0A5C6A0Q4_9BACT|nr:apolipoprotein N-acyltransferase [Stieleria varia]TWT92821.1 Apolipoprotein N-acyltransferase [Stieleria varia]
MNLPDSPPDSRKYALLGAVLLWCSQPPLGFWPLAFVALIPWMHCGESISSTRRDYLYLYAAAALYWLVSLQGLRHANPLIYPCWIALACYLAVYPVAAIAVTRRLRRWSVPMFLAFPIAWVGAEWVRNYMLTGISAAMLGHTMADIPTMIQIADLGGTYAVSFVIALVSAAMYQLWRERDKNGIAAFAVAAILLGATLGYGRYRLSQPTRNGSTVFALVQRGEPVEYEQDKKRALEIFDAYVRQSAQAVQQADQIVDVVVWPESMFTADLPWIDGDGSAEIAATENLTATELTSLLNQQRAAFEFRARRVQEQIAGKADTLPQLIVGCGVLRVEQQQDIFSGVVHVDQQSRVAQWYGKNHLVMFGEYVPLIGHIPSLHALIPMVTSGDGPRRFDVGSTTVAPNLCIETAVERVTIRHVSQLRSDNGGAPEVIVTVTNDGWFDDSAVIDHHQRCAQLVAVGCRRPILSAANNGPTVWIDSCGRIIDSVPRGDDGAVIAKPRLDDRTSLYVRIGDWPATMIGMVFSIAWLKILVDGVKQWRANRRGRRSSVA